MTHRWLRRLFSLTLLALSLPQSVFAARFGLGGYVTTDSNPADRVGELAELGVSISREEFSYGSVNYPIADSAVDRLRVRGIEILGLLHYHGSKPSVDDWRRFVTDVASHYQGKIRAWEVMNEVDNMMSGSEYASYLQASHDAIKAIDSGATVVASGLTGRSEAISFWNTLYDAGGASWFDALGLHPYRDRAPEIIEYNTGDFVGTVELAANVIRSHGGGKAIWLTEFGWRAGSVGDENQANWIARSSLLATTIPEVDQVIVYRLFDAGDSWGLVGSGGRRSAFDRYRSVVAPLAGAGRPSRVAAATKQTVVEPFDRVTSWDTTPSTNASLTVSEASGSTNGGMKLDYRFNADAAFVQAEKPIPLAGQPSAIGIWAKGPETTSVFKLRIRDATGETFQIDLGKLTSGWRLFSFVFGRDRAITSWGGNGTIDYPISFNSLIYERQGGPASGTVFVDELQVTDGVADLYAYTFGSTLAYWKASGSATVSLCGADRTATEAPQLATGIDLSSCAASPASSLSASASSPSAASAPAPAPASSSVSATSAVSAEQTSVDVSSGPVLADAKESYTVQITVRDRRGTVVTDRHPSLAFDEGAPVRADDFALEGDHWTSHIYATAAGTYPSVAYADAIELKKLTFTFDPVPAPPAPPPVVTVPSTQPPPSVSLPAVGAVAGLVSLLVGGWFLARHLAQRRKVAKPGSPTGKKDLFPNKLSR